MTADPADPSSDPPSPCIGVCILNPHTQLCDGCLRTLDEIAAWWDYTSDQKRVVLAQVEERLTRILDGTFFD
ncbi:MAG: DUF1289 domain-containing protein [Candidatus Contendobacter sp.]|nr:DUF1289 domain-containing protein [Candidatus Contendobacter sp.]